MVQDRPGLRSAREPGGLLKGRTVLGFFLNVYEYVFVGYVCVRCLVGICFRIVCFELCNSGGGMLSGIAPPSYRRSPEISGGEWI